MRRRAARVGIVGLLLLWSVALTTWTISWFKFELVGYSDGSDQSVEISLVRGSLLVSVGRAVLAGPALPARGFDVSFFRHWGPEQPYQTVHNAFKGDYLGFFPPNPSPWKIVPWHPRHYDEWKDHVEWQVARFEYIRGLQGFPDGEAVVYANRFQAPAWTMAAALAVPILPLLTPARRKTRASRRRAKGQCVQCGYALCGIRHRCPECGTPITSIS